MISSPVRLSFNNRWASGISLPQRDSASLNATPLLSILSTVGFSDFPEMRRPSQPAVFNASPNGPPHDEAAIIPVSGEREMASNRPEHGAPVPIRTPGIKARMFSGESGSHRLGNRSKISLRPSPFAPRYCDLISHGMSITVKVFNSRLTSKTLTMVPSI